MKLLIEYPLVLEKAVPARSQVPRKVIVKDVCILDVPEYGLSDAPVAMRRPMPGNMVVNYRAIGGDLFLRKAQPTIENGTVRYDFGFGRGGRRSSIFHQDVHDGTVESASMVCRNGKSHTRANIYPDEVWASYEWANAPIRYAPETHPAVNLAMLDAMKFVSFDEEAVERSRLAFAASASHVVIVDGRFMRKSPEPVYVAKSDAYEDQPTVSLADDLDIATLHKAEDVHPCRAYFPVDDLEGAREYAAEMWRLRVGDDEDHVVEMEGSAIEVLDGNLVTFDGEGMAAAMTARMMCEGFLRSLAGSSHWSEIGRHLDQVSVEGFAAYKRLSTSIAEYEHGNGGDSICAAARECLASGDTARFAPDKLLPLLELGIGRWEKREMRREFGMIF